MAVKSRVSALFEFSRGMGHKPNWTVKDKSFSALLFGSDNRFIIKETVSILDYIVVLHDLTFDSIDLRYYAMAFLLSKNKEHGRTVFYASDDPSAANPSIYLRATMSKQSDAKFDTVQYSKYRDSFSTEWTHIPRIKQEISEGFIKESQ